MSTSGAALGTIKLAHPVMNSAGPWAASFEQLKEIADSHSSAVVTKSFSVVPWVGNPTPNLHASDHYAINSIGLKNRGAAYFIPAATELRSDKPKIASVVGKQPEEYLELVRQLNSSAFDAIELNLSCPNVITKEPIGYSPEALEDLLKEVMRRATLPVGVKLPPYTSRRELQVVAELLKRMKVHHVVLINTFPLAAAVDDGGKPTIVPNDGVGGMSGTALKPIAIAHILLFRQFTDGVVPIVGVGGIQAQQDVADYLAAGASAVQVGTALLRDGLPLFRDLAGG